MKIGFLGYGEAGKAFHATLAEADPALSFCGYDRDPAALTGIEAVEPEGLAACDWVVSAVTADQSLKAAEAMAPHLRQGQVFIDINSVSPGRKEETARLVEGRGALYLDMAVMAPVHPRGHRTPVLLAGAIAAARAELERLGFAWTAAGPEAEGHPGQATAIKMIRSVFVKGLEAITVEALLSAAASGCLPQIMASLSGSYPGLGWPDHAAYSFERTLRHGKRRAAEMRESAATVDALGLNGGIAAETARIQQRMGDAEATALPDGPLEEAIPALLEMLRR